MLVWKAISSMVLTILLISLELVLISSMARIISFIFSLLSSSWVPISETF